MTRLDQATDARLRAIREEVRSGATEMVGKTKRDESGKIVARFGGGFSKMYPEVEHAGLTPERAARAVERGKGKPYQRLRRETRRELSKYIPESKKRVERPVVAPHQSLTRKCKVCGVAHGKGPHRFHGKGAYHSTHLFSFGGNPVVTPRKAKMILREGKIHGRPLTESQRRYFGARASGYPVRKNPQKNIVLIYGVVLSVDAQKTQAHRCDRECVKYRHKYRHVFKTRPHMYGLPNGDLLITTRRLS